MSFKICHIGCGSMSVRGHGPALHKYSSENDEVILSGCCDLDISRAEKFAQEFGFNKSYSDWEKMLEIERPSAVSLVVPVLMTADMSVEILKLGYSLITEKPPGMTKKECTRLFNAANNNISVAFNRRFMPLVKKLNELLYGKKIDYINYDFYRTGRKDKDFSTTAIHGIDTTLALLNERFSKINFDYQPLKSTPVGNILLSGTTINEARVKMNFYPDSGMNGERVTVIADNTTYFLNIPIWDCPDYPGAIKIYSGGKLMTEIMGEKTEMFISSGFYDEHRDFYDSIRNAKIYRAPVDQHLQAVTIMECIRNKEKQINF